VWLNKERSLGVGSCEKVIDTLPDEILLMNERDLLKIKLMLCLDCRSRSVDLYRVRKCESVRCSIWGRCGFCDIALQRISEGGIAVM